MTWDEKVEAIDWSKLQAEGTTPAIPVGLLQSYPIQASFEDEIGIEKFNMN